MPDYATEAALAGRLAGPVAGVDEVGRGCLAGPVMAAAAILDPARMPDGLVGAIDDSKRLAPARRESVAAALTELARADPAAVCFALGSADEAEILQHNILHAAMLAMTRAVEALSRAPAHVLVDGNRLPALPCSGTAVIGGDRVSLSIAAASIIAKVARDRLMLDLDRSFPGYGFAEHKGYGTATHRAALQRLGPCPAHRRGFRGVVTL